jgi:hypothetical protein
MMRISGWRGKARGRDEWKSVLREVKVLQGSLRHRVHVQVQTDARQMLSVI